MKVHKLHNTTNKTFYMTALADSAGNVLVFKPHGSCEITNTTLMSPTVQKMLVEGKLKTDGGVITAITETTTTEQENTGVILTEEISDVE